jgi:hypothetical protein
MHTLKHFSENLNHVGDLSEERRIILKGIIKKQDMRMWTGFSWIRI